MQIIYTGAHRDVVIAANGQVVVHGEPAEVPDDIARGLLLQPDWTDPNAPKDQAPDRALEGRVTF